MEDHPGTVGLAALGREGGPELVFLGTGSAIPSKYRNVSSIFLDIPGAGGLLMDAGEGCLSQLFRRCARVHKSNETTTLEYINYQRYMYFTRRRNVQHIQNHLTN
eukprot:58128-Prorocentrum_minimum.AAC.1